MKLFKQFGYIDLSGSTAIGILAIIGVIGILVVITNIVIWLFHHVKFV